MASAFIVNCDGADQVMREKILKLHGLVVESFPTIVELCKNFNASRKPNIVLYVTKGGDPPYDLWVLKRKFRKTMIIAETNKNNPDRIKKLKCWGAKIVITSLDELWAAIFKALREQKDIGGSAA